METLKKICSHLEDTVLGELGKDKTQIDAEELGEVIDAIKDIKMAIYYASITDAMENAEYGKDYDVNGKFYTQPRDSMGRYTSRSYIHNPSMEQYRDMDTGMGRMYYTDSNNMGVTGSANDRMYQESRYERARRGYEESKLINPGADNMKAMERMLDSFEEELKELETKMTPNEKNIARNKLANISNKMMM